MNNQTAEVTPSSPEPATGRTPPPSPVSLPSHPPTPASVHQETGATNTSTPESKGAPTGSPTMAILPPRLVAARDKLRRVRGVSLKVKKAYRRLSDELKPDLQPGEVPESEPYVKRTLATLGAEVTALQREEARMEREVVVEEQEAGILAPEEAEGRLRKLGRRLVSLGDELWQSEKRLRSEDVGQIRLLDPGNREATECILALYKRGDGLGKNKRPRYWKEDAMKYYDAAGINHVDTPDDNYFCQMSGLWFKHDMIKTAHIVPFFMDIDSISEILFGDRAESVREPGNALILSKHLKSWFDRYHIVVVPVDTREGPRITRWRTEIICHEIDKQTYSGGRYITEIDGKELQFLNENRPVSRFLYFHFLMALVRIKNLNRPGWRDTWAKYYDQRPFPTPGNYMRKSMLLALATHFDTTDMNVIDSWMVDHGFESPLKLSKGEATEAARRIHKEIEDSISAAEKRVKMEEDMDDDEDIKKENDDEDDEEEEDEEEDEEE